MALPIAAPGRHRNSARSAFRANAFSRSEAGGITNILEVVKKNVSVTVKLSAVDT